MHWIDPPNVHVPKVLREEVGGHPLVAELLVRRGIETLKEARAFMNAETYTPCAPDALPDMKRAQERLEKAIVSEEEILVWGDFDVDGQTSTALLVSALRELGGRVSHHIPHRERESHGVNIPNLEKHLDRGAELVLTCDTGVASHEAIDFATDEGVDVIVTDHHDLPPDLPEARAIINPKRLPEGHVLRTLPGVGVAYKLAQALFGAAGKDPERYLDLVALGIVADIAYQTGDTRYLLQRGLDVLRKAERPGIRAVMEEADVDPRATDEEDIGYRIGPRLNALGRLSDANIAVELLTTEDAVRAREIARELEDLNSRRRLLTDQVYEAATEQLRAKPELLGYAALVLYGQNWPAGVIGIVASRLVEDHYKPTVLLTGGSEGEVRGSARSIEGIDISQAIAAQKDYIGDFGGHPMAAGLSLAKSEIERFRTLLSRSIVEQRGEEELRPKLEVDQYVDLDELTLELSDELRRLAPFGPGNAPVTLAVQGVRAKEVRTIGSKDEHLKLRVSKEDQEVNGDGLTREVLYWNASASDVPEGPFDLAVSISENRFRGERSVQLTWRGARPAIGTGRSEAPAERHADTSGFGDCNVVYHDGAEDMSAVLRRLAAEDSVQVWLEGMRFDGFDAVTRTGLTSCDQLVLGTVPPSRSVLEAALARCTPETVHVVGVDAGVDDLDAFTRRLMGLCKHVTSEGEAVALERLAGAMGHTARTVRLGLAWLERQGLIWATFDAGAVQIRCEEMERNEDKRAETELRDSVEEARSFRSFLSKKAF